MEINEKRIQFHLDEAVRLSQKIAVEGGRPDGKIAAGQPSRKLALAATNAEQAALWIEADMKDKGIE